MYSTLLLEFSEDIAKITLNRPDKLNAINAQMIAELQCGIDAIEKRHSRVVIVTGAGASFFFFLAEDGIRALYVTGVQTCALPIYHRQRFGRRAHPEAAPRGARGQGLQHRGQRADVPPESARRPARHVHLWRQRRGQEADRRPRSEERRVGKESRDRRVPYRYKVNK